VLDRTLSGVFFTASEIEGVPSRLLATGPLVQPGDRWAGPSWYDLLGNVYELPSVPGSPTPMGLSDHQPFAKDFVLQGGDVADYRFATDRRGRPIYLKYQAYPSSDASSSAAVFVERFD
jgi:hypothetical protein